MNPSHAKFGVNWAVMAPAFTETAMMTTGMVLENNRTVTGLENKDAIGALIANFGVQG